MQGFTTDRVLLGALAALVIVVLTPLINRTLNSTGLIKAA